MKTYQEFLDYLKVFLKDFSTCLPVRDPDYAAIAFALARFLIADQYRWHAKLAAWPELPTVALPSDKEVVTFFSQHKGLPLSFRQELAARRMGPLRQAYAVLFPMLVLKHDFVAAIFRADLKARRFKAILRGYEARLGVISAKIAGLKRTPEFNAVCKRFTDHLVGYSLTLLQNKKLLDEALEAIAR
jgi:hypothetical protein